MAALAKLGIAVPCFREEIKLFHRNLAAELGGNRHFDPSRGTFEDLAKMIRTCDDDIFISWEMFSVYLSSKERLERLVTFFGGCGYRLSIVGYVRDYPGYFNSWYSQEVKRFQRHVDFSTYLTRRMGNPLHNFQHLFGPALDHPEVDVTIKHFDTCISTGLEWSLLDTILGGGYDRSLFTIPGRKNESPHPKTVYLSRLVAREIMSELSGAEDRHRYDRQVRRIAEKRGWTDLKFNGLTNELVDRISTFYREENDAFARRVWGTPWPEARAREYVSNEYDPQAASPEERVKWRGLVEKVVKRSRANAARAGQREYCAG